jgi:hypothetical protein
MTKKPLSWGTARKWLEFYKNNPAIKYLVPRSEP